MAIIGRDLGFESAFGLSFMEKLRFVSAGCSAICPIGSISLMIFSFLIFECGLVLSLGVEFDFSKIARDYIFVFLNIFF